MIPALLVALALHQAPAKRPVRSAAAVAAFRRAHPCPATGKPGPTCPGYVVDHVVPLCANGPDTPANMVYQRADSAAMKDRTEKALCRWIVRVRTARS